MEFAEEVLIFGTGFNAPPEQIQVSSSGPTCFAITRSSPAQPVESQYDSCSGGLNRPMILFIRDPVRQHCPYGPSDFVGLSHDCDIPVTTG